MNTFANPPVAKSAFKYSTSLVNSGSEYSDLKHELIVVNIFYTESIRVKPSLAVMVSNDISTCLFVIANN